MSPDPGLLLGLPQRVSRGELKWRDALYGRNCRLAQDRFREVFIPVSGKRKGQGRPASKDEEGSAEEEEEEEEKLVDYVLMTKLISRPFMDEMLQALFYDIDTATVWLNRESKLRSWLDKERLLNSHSHVIDGADDSEDEEKMEAILAATVVEDSNQPHRSMTESLTDLAFTGHGPKVPQYAQIGWIGLGLLSERLQRSQDARRALRMATDLRVFSRFTLVGLIGLMRSAARQGGTPKDVADYLVEVVARLHELSGSSTINRRSGMAVRRLPAVVYQCFAEAVVHSGLEDVEHMLVRKLIAKIAADPHSRDVVLEEASKVRVEKSHGRPDNGSKEEEEAEEDQGEEGTAAEGVPVRRGGQLLLLVAAALTQRYGSDPPCSTVTPKNSPDDGKGRNHRATATTTTTTAEEGAGESGEQREAQSSRGGKGLYGVLGNFVRGLVGVAKETVKVVPGIVRGGIVGQKNPPELVWIRAVENLIQDAVKWQIEGYDA